jgi:hypothetical protein
MRYSMKLLLLPLATVWFGCDSPAGPTDTGRDEEDLEFVRFPADLAPLAETSSSFWAVKGENRELRLRYTDSSGPGSDEFLRFEVPGRRASAAA